MADLGLQIVVRNDQRADGRPHVAATCCDGLFHGSLQLGASCVFGCKPEDTTLFQVDRLYAMFLFCSRGVKPSVRPRWALIRQNAECYVVRDAKRDGGLGCFAAMIQSVTVSVPTAVRVRDADRSLFAALAEPTVSALRVTIPRARADEHLAGGSRSRVPPDGGAMLTLLRLPF